MQQIRFKSKSYNFNMLRTLGNVLSTVSPTPSPGCVIDKTGSGGRQNTGSPEASNGEWLHSENQFDIINLKSSGAIFPNYIFICSNSMDLSRSS